MKLGTTKLNNYNGVFLPYVALFLLCRNLRAPGSKICSKSPSVTSNRSTSGEDMLKNRHFGFLLSICVEKYRPSSLFRQPYVYWDFSPLIRNIRINVNIDYPLISFWTVFGWIYRHINITNTAQGGRLAMWQVVNNFLFC